MANIDIKDALLLVAQASKDYTDSNIFSGDYNDLTNKPTIPSIDGLATEAYVDDSLPCKVNNHEVIKTIPASTIKNYTAILNSPQYFVINLDEALNLIVGVNYRVDFGKCSFVCTCVSDDDGTRLTCSYVEADKYYYDLIQIYDKCTMDLSTYASVENDNAAVLIFSSDYFNFYKESTITDCVISIEDANRLDSICLEDNIVINNSISIGRNLNTTIGRGSSAIGMGCEASGHVSHAEGLYTSALSMCSHAEGNRTTAIENGAHAEGVSINDITVHIDNVASATYSTIASKYEEGLLFTLAKGEGSHAEGCATVAFLGSHAEGFNTLASEYYSHVEGYKTKATSAYQHVQGKYNIADADGIYAHIVGNGSSSTRSNAHTLDWDGNAWYAGNITVGADNKPLATEEYVDALADIALVKSEQTLSNAEKDQVRSNLGYIGRAAVAGEQVTVDGITYTVEQDAEIFGDYTNNIAIGSWSIAEGSENIAVGKATHVEGAMNKGIGTGCHVEGVQCTASGYWSHAEGERTIVSSYASHAEGSYTTLPDGTTRYGTASGYASHIEGGGCHASGSCSHAEGLATTVSGNHSHVEGRWTVAASSSQHVEGTANIEDTEGKYIHIAGNGSWNSGEAVATRSNAYTLDWDGNGWFAGNVTVGADNKVLATEEFVNNIVVIDEDELDAAIADILN